MKITTFPALILWMLLSGCQTMTHEYHYRVVLVNLSQSEITDSQVLDSTDTYNYGGGVLIPTGYSAYAGPMETPPNDVFILRWKDSGGQEKEQKFDLREQVKRNFDGEIVFVYNAKKTFGVEIVQSPARYPIPLQRPE